MLLSGVYMHRHFDPDKHLYTGEVYERAFEALSRWRSTVLPKPLQHRSGQQGRVYPHARGRTYRIDSILTSVSLYARSLFRSLLYKCVSVLKTQRSYTPCTTCKNPYVLLGDYVAATISESIRWWWVFLTSFKVLFW